MTKDLSFVVFKVLTDFFFDDEGEGVNFSLKNKKNGKQDDPFDEKIIEILSKGLPANTQCVASTGKLISPDLAVMVKNATAAKLPHLETCLGIEVKKLQKGKTGKSPRASSMDFNSTPPSPLVKVYSSSGEELLIHCFYLVVSLSESKPKKYKLESMCLCDGKAINDDVKLYNIITGKRKKSIDLGTYGDGANRNRPMMLFGNPLSQDSSLGKSLLIHSNDFECGGEDRVVKVGGFKREIFQKFEGDIEPQGKEFNEFYYYGLEKHYKFEKITKSPFKAPLNRTEDTIQRGRFLLPIS